MATVRERKEFLESDTCSFQLSYSDVDVRKALKAICRASLLDGLNSEDNWSEAQLRYSLQEVLRQSLPDKLLSYLAKWAFKMSIRKSLVVKSAEKENCFYFADCIKSR